MCGDDYTDSPDLSADEDYVDVDVDSVADPDWSEPFDEVDNSDDDSSDDDSSDED